MPPSRPSEPPSECAESTRPDEPPWIVVTVLLAGCLRAVDAVVRRLSLASGFEAQVWQFPVVLIPVGTVERPDAVVLRPIHSVDGMTASSVPMPDSLLQQMREELLAVEGISAVF